MKKIRLFQEKVIIKIVIVLVRRDTMQVNRAF